jgi:hypothetical protein
MTSHRKSNLIWLLLPLLALRALVPAGFMLDASSDGLSMVICSGGVYKTVSVDHGDQAPVTDHGQQTQHGDSICPFAVAATGAPAPSALPMVLGALSAIGIVANDVAEFHSLFGPSRVQQSRAPPYFS